MLKKLPIGIQTFEKIIDGDYLVGFDICQSTF
jgi:hypothetical protein